MTKIEPTQGQVDTIIRMRKQNKSYQYIADALGFKKSALFYFMQRDPRVVDALKAAARLPLDDARRPIELGREDWVTQRDIVDEAGRAMFAAMIDAGIWFEDDPRAVAERGGTVKAPARIDQSFCGNSAAMCARS